MQALKWAIKDTTCGNTPSHCPSSSPTHPCLRRHDRCVYTRRHLRVCAVYGSSTHHTEQQMQNQRQHHAQERDTQALCSPCIQCNTLAKSVALTHQPLPGPTPSTARAQHRAENADVTGTCKGTCTLESNTPPSISRPMDAASTRHNCCMQLPSTARGSTSPQSTSLHHTCPAGHAEASMGHSGPICWCSLPDPTMDSYIPVGT